MSSSEIVSAPQDHSSGSSRKLHTRAGHAIVSGFRMGARPVKAVGSILADFKTFISRGNVVDLAVGIVMGTAFTAVVNSFVTDIIAPIISYPLRVNFDKAFVVMRCPLNVTVCGPYNTIEQGKPDMNRSFMLPCISSSIPPC